MLRPTDPAISGDWLSTNSPAHMTNSATASKARAPIPPRKSSPNRPTPIKTLTIGSTIVSVAWEAVIGPAWNAS